MMRRCPAPAARAATTNSLATSDRTAARVTRAVSIHPTIPTRITSAGKVGCSVAAATIRSNSRGTDRTASVARISTVSVQPPT